MRGLAHMASGLGLLGALVATVLSVLEKLVNASGYTILRGATSPTRLLTLAGVLLLFVIAIELREIRLARR